MKAEEREMTNYRTHFISAAEARDIARVLKAAGYKVTIATCREQVPNVVQRVAGSDPDATKRVEQVIETVLNRHWNERQENCCKGARLYPLPYVVRVRQDGRAQVGSNFEEWIDFSATLSDGRVITVHTGSLSAPTFEPDVDDDLAEEIFAELPE